MPKLARSRGVRDGEARSAEIPMMNHTRSRQSIRSADRAHREERYRLAWRNIWYGADAKFY